MHLHQPDWKSRVWAVDGRVDARHHSDRPHVSDRRWTWYTKDISYLTMSTKSVKYSGTIWKYNTAARLLYFNLLRCSGEWDYKSYLC